MKLPRASGILLHPTSLPGSFGIGDLGSEAHAFVDFLAETGQTWWQMLPLGPTGYGNSPYQSPSSFAGNPLLISPRGLVDRGWLRSEEIAEVTHLPSEPTSFETAAELKKALLVQAFERFRNQSTDPAFDAFRSENQFWLNDYVLFQAIRDAHNGLPWYEWEPGLVHRDPAVCARWRADLGNGVAFHEFVQYVFESQWQELRAVCRAKGIMLIGDVPIFVAQDSADVWSHPELYDLDEQGKPRFMAGVPPDYFSETGQLWGNPLYRWDVHARDGYQWWILRLRSILKRVDIIRIDHFRGFEAYWEVPAGSQTAATGRWVPGPGRDFFKAICNEFGSVPLIAEDLGLITPEVEALRDEFNLPGMRVIQFGFAGDSGSEKHLPHRYVPHCLAYTGTHDNDTSFGWYHSKAVTTTQPPGEVEAAHRFALRYTNAKPEDIHWGLIRVVSASAADTVIFPLQDILGLDSNSRMNFPGKAEGNWLWRYHKEQLNQNVRDGLANLTALYGRWNGNLPARWDPRYRPQ